ncbi:hypothetical protein [Bifidobacterium animalis]|nr:hypothetical protein [Bifidobacterium animalis]
MNKRKAANARRGVQQWSVGGGEEEGGRERKGEEEGKGGEGRERKG